MTDPNMAFKARNTGTFVRNCEGNTFQVLLTTFIKPSKPPEIAGLVGMTEQDLKMHSLVNAYHSEIEILGDAKVKKITHYIRFINGLVYSYSVKSLAHAGMDVPGLVLIRSRNKEMP